MTQLHLPGFDAAPTAAQATRIMQETLNEQGFTPKISDFLHQSNATSVRYHIILRADGLVDVEYIFTSVTDGRINNHFELAYYDANMRAAIEQAKYSAPVLKKFRIVQIKELE